MASPLFEAPGAPPDGLLPAGVVEGATARSLGLYVHIPFCAARCGYCDFNTYTAQELVGVNQESYPLAAAHEMDFAHRVLRESGLPPRNLATVFFGGGTPTLLGPRPLLGLLDRARELWGLGPQAEITVEANPDGVSASDLEQLARGGVTRLSLGVQSAVPSVLATLDRTHDPQRVGEVVGWAKDAGLAVSVDIIYGSPGETLEHWDTTLEAVASLAPDHVSAYSLVVEPGTALAKRIARGELEAPTDDVHASMYERADSFLAEAGYQWYEISNWATQEEYESLHHRNYWTTHDWWGIGPGAHSHVGGVRWWNVPHPTAYTRRISRGVSPASERENLSRAQHNTERVLLGLRVREGIPAAWVESDRAPLIAEFISRGFLDGRAALGGRLVLTGAGRLVADYLVRELT